MFKMIENCGLNYRGGHSTQVDLKTGLTACLVITLFLLISSPTHIAPPTSVEDYFSAERCSSS